MNISIPFEELVAFARANCPYYRESYAHLPPNPRLTDLPVVDRLAYWDAHLRDYNNVLTGPLLSGIILSSGGTTGAPKLAYHDHSDWDRGLVTTGMGFDHLGLKENDRVANLFAAGEMYGSYIATTASMKAMRATKVLQLPLSYATPNANVVNWVRRFKVNVLASGPTRLLNFLYHLDRENIRDLAVNRLLFAGESFFPEQRAIANRLFPDVVIQSIGYGTVDAGMIGYADTGCAADEHRTINVGGWTEILDPETHQQITEPGVTGYIVFTNLIRKLHPVLRYPTGDMGRWVERPEPDERGMPRDNCKYLLLGRTHQGFRMAFQSFEMFDFDRLMVPFASRFGLRQYQAILYSRDGREGMTFHLDGDVSPEDAPAASAEVHEAIMQRYSSRPDLRKFIADGAIWPVEVRWVAPEEILVNERTGKLRPIVDHRRAEAPAVTPGDGRTGLAL